MRQDRKAAQRPPINENITAREVRLIGPDGEQVGVVSIQEALSAAEEAKLDLVEISPDATPPVCRIMDYGKHIFEKKKQQAAARKNQKQIQIKEIKFRPKVDEHDYQFKKKHIERFLADGDKVKATIFMRGREQAHPEIGRRILERLVADLGDQATQETMPRREGNTMHTILSQRTPGKGADKKS